jgi:hypothetical protein
MSNFHVSAVRFNKPGLLYIATLGSVEPTTVSSSWDAAWVPLGYTAEGSVLNYEISSEPVDVAEELEPIDEVVTGRDPSVEFALAEKTYRNLTAAFNGGIVTGDGQNWTFEPPDLGNETRVMLGWDETPTVANNRLRYVFRKCLQSGNLSIENRKGANKSTLTCNFKIRRPDDGSKPLKIWGAGVLNPII